MGSSPALDAALAGVPSTESSKDDPSKVVLLPGLAGKAVGPSTSPAVRFLLGPARLSSGSFQSAKATNGQIGGWVIDYVLTKAGSALWNRVNRQYFHSVLAFDLNGTVVGAPIIEPDVTSFSSFDGAGQIAENFSRKEAVKLAKAFGSTHS
jgi:preprotein translocase subunit SecD